jgi:hypothetical protein
MAFFYMGTIEQAAVLVVILADRGEALVVLHGVSYRAGITISLCKRLSIIKTKNAR